jgi:hypothetical protein
LHKFKQQQNKGHFRQQLACAPFRCLQVRHWADIAAASGQLLAQTLFARRPGVHVMHITSEMVPVAKVRAVAHLLFGHVVLTCMAFVMPAKFCWHDCCVSLLSVSTLSTTTATLCNFRAGSG